MKKIGIILAVLLVVIILIAAFASGEEETSDQGSGSAASSTDTVNSENATSTNDDNAVLGNYSVIIDNCRLAKDYEGKDVVIVKYIFTNNSSDEAESFWLSIDDAVFQNGVGLNEAYILDDSANYSADNQRKELQKGASVDVEVAYELNDTSSDIQVEVKKLVSFDDKKLTKTFTIK